MSQQTETISQQAQDWVPNECWASASLYHGTFLARRCQAWRSTATTSIAIGVNLIGLRLLVARSPSGFVQAVPNGCYPVDLGSRITSARLRQAISDYFPVQSAGISAEFASLGRVRLIREAGHVRDDLTCRIAPFALHDIGHNLV